MINKEIKKGDKIWLYASCLSYDSYYVVSSVKKEKTLITVVVDVPAKYGYKDYQITMYGHASSSLLSGYDIKYRNKDIEYTCDYKLIEKKTEIYEQQSKYREAGYDFLRIVKYFK